MSLDIELKIDGDCVWSGNMTHNLNKIAIEAGVYECIWRPDEIGIKYAKDNIGNLRQALSRFYAEYDDLAKLNPSNGWGTLDGLIEFTKAYLEACIEYPDAEIKTDRQDKNNDPKTKLDDKRRSKHAYPILSN